MLAWGEGGKGKQRKNIGYSVKSFIAASFSFIKDKF